MGRMRAHIIKKVSGILLGLCFLVCLFSLFLWLARIGMNFESTFTVENRLEHAIWITPVGRLYSSGPRRPLHVSFVYIISLPALQRGGYQLKPKGKITVTHDADEFISEIVIESEAGVIGQLTNAANPGKNLDEQIKTQFLIQQDSLTPVSLPVLEVAKEARDRDPHAILMWLVLVVPWPTFVFLFWGYWRMKKLGLQKDIIPSGSLH